MRLTAEQLKRYDEDGFIVLRGIMTPAELRLLQADAEMLRTPGRGHPAANVYEKDGSSIRAAWAPYVDSEAVDLAMRLPRILGPVRQLMGDDVYLYQSRLNYKVARRGDVFQWHQDYQSWAMDGVPDGGHRQMLSVLVMLDECESSNGPLRLIRGSHRGGHIAPEYDTTTTSYALHIVTDDLVDALLGGDAPHECDGPAGTVVIFGGCVVHGSEQNNSPRDRRNLYFAYNTRDNVPPPGEVRRKHANDYIMNEDTDALQYVADDALVELANERGLTALDG